ncbi:MAG: glycosyltransferase family 1 protein, partial [Sphingobacteriaceae bacterium]
WDNHDLNVTVIENGVTVNAVSFSGENPAGVLVLEEFPADDRITGMDILRQVKEALPIDVIQIGKDGLTYQNLPEKLKNYRFLFCADRYQSPQFAVFTAMMLGMPVVGLGTTALPTMIENEVSGFVHSDLNYLINKMQTLIYNQQLAVQLGVKARETAVNNYTSTRFLADWNQLFAHIMKNTSSVNHYLTAQ